MGDKTDWSQSGLVDWIRLSKKLAGDRSRVWRLRSISKGNSALSSFDFCRGLIFTALALV